MSEVENNLNNQKKLALKFLKDAKSEIDTNINEETLEKIYDFCFEASIDANKNIQNFLEKIISSYEN